MGLFKVGDIVDESEPFAHVLNDDLKGERCDYCFKLCESLSRCSNCKWMYYCDKRCQLSDWKTAHKYECKEYKLDIDRESKLFIRAPFTRLLLRLLFIISKNPARATQMFKTYNEKERCFNDLMDHVEDIKLNEKSTRWYLAQETFNRFCCIGSLNVDANQFFSTFGKIVINSFSILNISLNEIGTGLYMSASIFDHDCQPNCSPIFDGVKLSIRCVRNFDSLKEPATITYIDLKLPRDERLLKLKDQYYFDCTCTRCSIDEEDTIGRRLIELNEKFDDYIESGNWVKAFTMGLKTLPLYEKIYKTYYADFTVQLMRLAKIRANIVNGPQDSDELVFLINRLQQAIQITHGKDHPMYKEEFAQLTGLA